MFGVSEVCQSQSATLCHIWRFGSCYCLRHSTFKNDVFNLFCIWLAGFLALDEVAQVERVAELLDTWVAS